MLSRSLVGSYSFFTYLNKTRGQSWLYWCTTDWHFAVLMLLERRSACAISGVTKWAKDSWLFCTIIQQAVIRQARARNISSPLMQRSGTHWCCYSTLWQSQIRSFFYSFVLKSVHSELYQKSSLSQKNERLLPWWAVTEFDHCWIQKREGDGSSQSHYRFQMNQGTHELCMR